VRDGWVSYDILGGGGGGSTNTGSAGTGGGSARNIGGAGASGTSGENVGDGGTYTGGGAGGGDTNHTGPTGNGGSGIVILKYPDTYTITVGEGLTSSTTSAGGYKITTFIAGTDNVSWS
jgi:hypothetical protein